MILKHLELKVLTLARANKLNAYDKLLCLIAEMDYQAEKNKEELQSA